MHKSLKNAALAVLRALHDLGKKVPDDVAVVRSDSFLPAGIYLIPKLTTVMMDYARLAELAVGRIIRRLSRSDAGCHVRLSPVLEVRESSLAR